MLWRRTVALTLAAIAGAPFGLCAQSQAAKQAAATEGLQLDTGKEIFESACMGCHGPGGKGQPESTLGFEHPPTYPDFSDCNGSTRERKADWKATIHEGGRGRGFSEIMPSFADALTPVQIDMVMTYLRSLCEEPHWPLGELNLPRALLTEKAFPEDEIVVSTAVNVRGGGEASTKWVYEKRLGARNQVEFVLPLNFLKRDNGGWVGGTGDIVFGYKRVLAHNIASGSILSVQGEVATPTGNRLRGLGSGVTKFETFAAFGQLFPRTAFLQVQSGAELPVNTDKGARAAFVRSTFGKTFAQDSGFGRIWTPMTEFIVDREFETGARTNLDLIPEVQISLNRRQHIRANVGLRFPVNNRADRPTQLIFYLLWDWFDGGLRDGW